MKRLRDIFPPFLYCLILVSIALLNSCGDLNLNVEPDVPDSTVETQEITISGTLCIDGDETGTCNDVGFCSNTRYGDQTNCEKHAETWHEGADMAVRNAKIYLKDGGSIVKVGRTVQDGTYEIRYVNAGSTYLVEPVKNGYSFSPASLDTNWVNQSDPTADFTAEYFW